MFTNASTSVAHGTVETCEKHPFLHFLTSHFLTFFVHSPLVMGKQRGQTSFWETKGSNLFLCLLAMVELSDDLFTASLIPN
ncbi:hypothetical protein Rcae01_01914 [Novipirellula caenicola]|uniref:Uncharacterized protein n=1 Tax=Novipirellula caenicola TaxID=1536901 RepID=A0ABP9VMP4_9BACT